MRSDAPAPGRLTVISALGVVEILAWGSSFYLPVVLAGPIADNTGWPLTWVVGGLSIGLLVAAIASPRVGIAIHRHGGRPVLASAALLLAAGHVVLGLAPNLPVCLPAGSCSALAWVAGFTTPPSPPSAGSTAPRRGRPSQR